MFNKLFSSCLLILAVSAFARAQEEAATTTTKTTTTKTTTTKTAPTTSTRTTVQSLDAKAVRAVFDKLIKGIEESDVELVTSVYQNSPTTLYYNNNGTVTRGWEQDRANRTSRYSDVTNAKLNARDVRIEMLGSTGAVLTCLWTQTQDYKGTTETASGRMTLVLKKIGKDWKVVHLHTSPDNPPATRPVFPSERSSG